MVALFCLPLFRLRSASPSLLLDSDTAFLLKEVRARNAPFSWFGGDWPLGNHFYRPVSTLSFELDNRLYGDNAAGYGWTNLLLVIGSVFALYWLIRELSDSVALSVTGAATFALWCGDTLAYGSGLSWFWALPFLLLLVPGRSVRAVTLASLLLLVLSQLLATPQQLAFRMIQWLPGRTASVMTLMLLIALALFARSIRLGSPRVSPDPSPLDPPATRGSRQTMTIPTTRFLVVGALLGALALGSYEQAVMLPFLGLLIGWHMWRQGHRAWLAPTIVGGILSVVYVLVRLQLVPLAASGYQKQQFRDGPAAWWAISDYAFPGLGNMVTQWKSWVGPNTLLLPGFYTAHFVVVAVLLTAWVLVKEVKKGRRDAILALTGYALSVVAFLPMAFLKHFDHYHFLPLALRALLAAGMLGVVVRLLVIAASLPARQAPSRSDPAPGSLLRR